MSSLVFVTVSEEEKSKALLARFSNELTMLISHLSVLATFLFSLDYVVTQPLPPHVSVDSVISRRLLSLQEHIEASETRFVPSRIGADNSLEFAVSSCTAQGPCSPDHRSLVLVNDYDPPARNRNPAVGAPLVGDGHLPRWEEQP